jgi:hypothetical protein
MLSGVLAKFGWAGGAVWLVYECVMGVLLGPTVVSAYEHLFKVMGAL